MTKELDAKIRALCYNPEQVLAYRGDNISNFKPNEGRLEDGKYIPLIQVKMSA
ncbi:MAG: thiol-activated cytolysin family protein [Fibrobacteraceae bacterium]